VIEVNTRLIELTISTLELGMEHAITLNCNVFGRAFKGPRWSGVVVGPLTTQVHDSTRVVHFVVGIWKRRSQMMEEERRKLRRGLEGRK
jgi:hypothetical protein